MTKKQNLQTFVNFGLKEEHWKILSLRAIKCFMEKMFHGKEKKDFDYFN